MSTASKLPAAEQLRSNLLPGEQIASRLPATRKKVTELPGFATLQELRIGENIKVYDSMDTKVHNSKAAVYAKVELSKRENNILVFDKHSDKMIDDVLGSIDPEDSGYVFFASELNIDPVRNCMVPRHRLATGVETEELVNRNIQLKKLPRLLMLDPIRRWHNFSRGSVVAIERHDGSMYYRLVV